MRTLVLVVHGIGSQRAWESLACVAEGLLRYARAQGQRVALEPRIERVGGDVEAVVRLRVGGASPRVVDVREFHWQGLVAGRASARAVAAWLARSAFVSLNVPRAWRALAPHGPKLALLALMRQLLQALVVLLGLLLLGVAGASAGVAALQVLMAASAGEWLGGDGVRALLLMLLVAGAGQLLRSHVGDLALYLSEHPASPWHATRVAVHTALARQLQVALADHNTERVVVVAHSLGGVVALDALDTLWRLEAGNPRLARLHGLLTLASPLDQVARFHHAPARAGLNLHVALQRFWSPTRRLLAPPQTPPWAHAPNAFPKMQWVNVHVPADIFSDPQHHYRVDARVNLTQLLPFGAHARPWRDPATYALLDALACGRDARSAAARLCSAREATPARPPHQRDWRRHGRQRRRAGGRAHGRSGGPVRTAATPHDTRPPQRPLR